jgi:hypothetical protein
MKLSPEQIRYICEKVLRTLKDQHIVVFKTEEPKVLERMVKAFEKNLLDEQKLEEDAQKALLAIEDQMKDADVNKTKMFNLIKKKLADERGFIL